MVLDKKYIFFDLDGTLTDPSLGITNSIMYALDKMGREIPPREKLYCFIGPPLIPSFREFLGMTKEEAGTALKFYRVYFAEKGIFENEPYEGIADALSEIKRSGKTVVLATSKPEEFARKILFHFDLAKYFDCICGSTMDEKRTEKADVISYALETANADASDSVMIGDRMHDIIGAQKNCMDTIGVLWGFGTKAELENAGAGRIVKTIRDMTEIIVK